MGGTLSLLTSSLGTATSRPARDGIVLLEDTGEQPHRLDRMLTQLRRSDTSAAWPGSWPAPSPAAARPRLIHDILAERLGDLGVPMIAWANVGHGGRSRRSPSASPPNSTPEPAELRLLDSPLR